MTQGVGCTILGLVRSLRGINIRTGVPLQSVANIASNAKYFDVFHWERLAKGVWASLFRRHKQWPLWSQMVE